MGRRTFSTEGMAFEYDYNGLSNAAYFGYGNRSVVYSLDWEAWHRLSTQEKEKWRKEKYAEAMRLFGIRGGHHGSV